MENPDNKALLQRLEASGVACLRENSPSDQTSSRPPASSTSEPDGSQSELGTGTAKLRSETCSPSSSFPSATDSQPPADHSFKTQGAATEARHPHGSSRWVHVLGPPLHGLNNMTLVVTGRLAVRGITRNEFKDLVEASGGELVERWSNSVQLVVLGDKPGDNKIQKAIELGVPIMSEADFWNKYS